MKKNNIKVRIDSRKQDAFQLHIDWELPPQVLSTFLPALFEAKKQALILNDPNPCFRCENGDLLTEQKPKCWNCSRDLTPSQKSKNK